MDQFEHSRTQLFVLSFEDSRVSSLFYATIPKKKKFTDFLWRTEKKINKRWNLERDRSFQRQIYSFWKRDANDYISERTMGGDELFVIARDGSRARNDTAWMLQRAHSEYLRRDDGNFFPSFFFFFGEIESPNVAANTHTNLSRISLEKINYLFISTKCVNCEGREKKGQLIKIRIFFSFRLPRKLGWRCK